MAVSIAMCVCVRVCVRVLFSLGAVFSGGVDDRRGKADLHVTVITDNAGTGEMHIVAKKQTRFSKNTEETNATANATPTPSSPSSSTAVPSPSPSTSPSLSSSSPSSSSSCWSVDQLILTFPACSKSYVYDFSRSYWAESSEYIVPATAFNPSATFADRAIEMFKGPSTQVTQDGTVVTRKTTGDDGWTKWRATAFVFFGLTIAGVGRWFYRSYKRNAFFRYISPRLDSHPTLHSMLGPKLSIDSKYGGTLTATSGNLHVAVKGEGGKTATVNVQGVRDPKSGQWRVTYATAAQGGGKPQKLNLE